MKTTKLVTLGLIGLSVAALAAPTAQATTKEANSKATVEFTTEWPVFTPNSTEDASVAIQFPNAIDGTKVKGSTLGVKDGKVNLTASDFDIIYVTDFYFGKQNYTGAKMDRIYATNGKFKAADGTTDVTAPLGFSIGSLGTTPDWSLTATMTPFYKDGDDSSDKMIVGTTIDLHNVTANNVLNKNKNAEAVNAAKMTLKGDGSSKANIGFFTGGDGMAVNNFAFNGTEEDGSTGDGSKGVELHIPAGANIENGEYIATITWTIENGPFQPQPQP